MKNEMKEKLDKFREYLDYIEEHYDNVQKAWKVVSEKCSDMRFVYDDFYWHTIDNNVKNHDLSKLSKEEFTQYRNYFFPIEGEEKNKQDFERAWENHKKENIHHWENWTNAKWHPGSPFDEIAFVENIVDWMAMGYKFGDTAKDYYEKNKDKIHLPDWAVRFMYQIFERVYK